MAIVTFTGFEPYGDATGLQQAGYIVSGSVSIATADSRTFLLLGAGASIRRIFSSTYPTLIMGADFYFPSAPSSEGIIMAFQDGSTNQVDVRLTPQLALRVTRNGTTLGTTSDGIVPTGTYIFIGMRATIHDTLGSVRLMVGVTDVLTLSNVDTQETANPYANAIEIRGAVASQRVDNLYIFDATGSENNDLAGPIRVGPIVVVGPGTYTQWTPNGASANYDCVDDVPHDGDATFVSATDPNRIDSYAVSVPAGMAAVRGIKLMVAARKDDAAPRAITPGVVIGSAFYAATSAPVALPDNYAWIESVLERNPATGSPWTLSDLMGIQLAIRSDNV